MPHIPLEPLKSSNVSAAGYDPATLTLRVQFDNGRVYDYNDVEPVLAGFFFASPSHGETLNKRIKPDCPAHELTDEEMEEYFDFK